MNLSFLGGSSISLDIGSAAIRVVEMKHKKNGKSTLLHYASLPIPTTAQDGSTLAEVPEDVVIGLIRQAMGDAGVSGKDVSIGIPTNKTFSVIVDLPKIDKREEQEKVIPIQAEEHIPNAIDSVDLDWHILGDSPVEQGKMEVLLTTTEKSYNAQRIEMIEKAGLNVISIEPDAYALPKALMPYGSKKTHIIIESGNIETDLVVAIDGKPRLVRTIPIGVQHIVSEVAKHMSIDMAQSQAYVYKFGLMQDKLEGQVYGAVKVVVQSIVDEIQKSMKYILNRYGEVQFSDVVVSGFAAFIPAINDYIQDVVKVPTLSGDAWVNVDFPEDQRARVLAEKNVFSVAVGLARRLD